MDPGKTLQLLPNLVLYCSQLSHYEAGSGDGPTSYLQT